MWSIIHWWYISVWHVYDGKGSSWRRESFLRIVDFFSHNSDLQYFSNQKSSKSHMTLVFCSKNASVVWWTDNIKGIKQAEWFIGELAEWHTGDVHTSSLAEQLLALFPWCLPGWPCHFDKGPCQALFTEKAKFSLTVLVNICRETVLWSTRNWYSRSNIPWNLIWMI